MNFINLQVVFQSEIPYARIQRLISVFGLALRNFSDISTLLLFEKLCSLKECVRDNHRSYIGQHNVLIARLSNLAWYFITYGTLDILLDVLRVIRSYPKNNMSGALIKLVLVRWQVETIMRLRRHVASKQYFDIWCFQATVVADTPLKMKSFSKNICAFHVAGSMQR